MSQHKTQNIDTDNEIELQLFKSSINQVPQKLAKFQNTARGLAERLILGRKRGIEELRGPGVDDHDNETVDRELLRQLDEMNLDVVEEDLDLSRIDPLSEQNEERKVLHLFKDRNLGAKEFDDFARGIQTWFSMVELEAMRRYHSLYVGPVTDAMEEYVERLALELMDLILKALLLCKLRKSRRAAGAVAKIALEAILKMLQEIGKEPSDVSMVTAKVLEELEAEGLVN